MLYSIKYGTQLNDVPATIGITQEMPWKGIFLDY